MLLRAEQEFKLLNRLMSAQGYTVYHASVKVQGYPSYRGVPVPVGVMSYGCINDCIDEMTCLGCRVVTVGAHVNARLPHPRIQVWQATTDSA